MEPSKNYRNYLLVASGDANQGAINFGILPEDFAAPGRWVFEALSSLRIFFSLRAFCPICGKLTCVHGMLLGGHDKACCRCSHVTVRFFGVSVSRNIVVSLKGMSKSAAAPPNK